MQSLATPCSSPGGVLEGCLGGHLGSIQSSMRRFGISAIKFVPAKIEETRKRAARVTSLLNIKFFSFLHILILSTLKNYLVLEN